MPFERRGHAGGGGHNEKGRAFAVPMTKTPIDRVLTAVVARLQPMRG
jgi:hypothetical protein